MDLPGHMIVTRVLEATPEQIWSAFTDPDQLCQFFGPEGTHCPRESITIDLRVGGEFRLTMTGDDSGEEWPMEAEYAIVEEPTRFQLNTSRGGTITIEIQDLEMEGRTLVTWTSKGNYAALGQEFYSGSVIGTHKTMDQLGEFLSTVREGSHQ
ncbi:MAG: SRPBCC family protein [Solirubrobacterales bacterium]